MQSTWSATPHRAQYHLKKAYLHLWIVFPLSEIQGLKEIKEEAWPYLEIHFNAKVAQISQWPASLPSGFLRTIKSCQSAAGDQRLVLWHLAISCIRGEWRKERLLIRRAPDFSEEGGRKKGPGAVFSLTLVSNSAVQRAPGPHWGSNFYDEQETGWRRGQGRKSEGFGQTEPQSNIIGGSG